MYFKFMGLDYGLHIEKMVKGAWQPTDQEVDDENWPQFWVDRSDFVAAKSIAQFHRVLDQLPAVDGSAKCPTDPYGDKFRLLASSDRPKNPGLEQMKKVYGLARPVIVAVEEYQQLCSADRKAVLRLLVGFK